LQANPGDWQANPVRLQAASYNVNIRIWALEKCPDLLKIRSLAGIQVLFVQLPGVGAVSQPARIHSVSVSCARRPLGSGLLCPLWWHTMRANLLRR